MKWTLQTSNIRNTILNCHLFLGRKAMTNLDSIFKSRDIILLTKVRLVKTMVFPVVMYKCESWTMKKAKCQRTDAFKLWCWRRLLSPLDSKELKTVSLNSEYSLEGVTLSWRSNILATWCKEPNSLEKTLMLGRIGGRRRRSNRGWDDWMALSTQ